MRKSTIFSRKGDPGIREGESQTGENPGGIKNMDRLPGAIFVVDPERKNRRQRGQEIGILHWCCRYQLQSRGGGLPHPWQR